MTERRYVTVAAAYDRVAAAVRDYVADYIPAHGRFVQLWRVRFGAAALLGFRDDDGVTVLNYPDRFRGQVLRALNAMSDAGELVKVGQRERGPVGGSSSGPVWYTPASYEQAQQAAEEGRRAAEATRAAWGDVHDRLAALAFPASGSRDGPVYLSLGDWQRLVGTFEEAERVLVSRPRVIDPG